MGEYLLMVPIQTSERAVKFCVKIEGIVKKTFLDNKLPIYLSSNTYDSAKIRFILIKNTFFSGIRHFFQLRY